VAFELAKDGRISEDSLALVRDLAGLRNVAAHGPEELSTDQALEFVELASVVRFLLGG
jgi:hypothetical protein